MNDFSQDSPEMEFDFRRYLFLARKFLWLILLLPIVGGLAAWFYGKKLPDIYLARATMMVEPEERKFINVEDFQSDKVTSDDFLNTVTETLRSRSLMEEVAKSETIRSRPEFANQDPLALAGRFTGQVSVSIRPYTRLIDIVIEDRDPILARDLAKEVYEAFIRITIAQRSETTKMANAYLLEEEVRSREKLEASEQKLQKYKEEHNSSSLADRQNIVVDQLRQTNSESIAAKNERLRLETDLALLNNLPSNETQKILEVASVAELPQVVAARAQLAEAKSDFEVLKQRYLSKHPKFIAAERRIEELTRTLAETARQATSILGQRLDAAKLREERLSAALKEQETKALELDRITIPYNVLAREVASDRVLYETVVARLKDSGVTQNLKSLPFRLTEPPLVPGGPSKPNRRKLLLVGIFGGLALALSMIVLTELLDHTCRSVDDVERLLDTNVLAAVFQVPNSFIKETNGLVFSNDPNSQFAEPFRTLRASLSLLGDETRRKIFLVTSAVPGEGKSFTSLNLAASFAQQGLKTILIDADLRRPTIHKALSLAAKTTAAKGLTEYLSGLAELTSCALPIKDSLLTILPAGGRSPAPAELLTSDAMRNLLTKLEQEYDRVVVDSPPVNAVSDALLLAPLCHAVCLVIKAAKTPKKAVLRAYRVLKKSGAKIAGVVLNNIRKDEGASYYYYYYGKEYETAEKSAKKKERTQRVVGTPS